ncbi:MAG: M23 family metallopeptidase [Desulfatiglandales bacterium]
MESIRRSDKRTRDRLAGVFLALLLVIPVTVKGVEPPPWEIDISSKIIPQGGVGLLRVLGVSGGTLKAAWREKEVILASNPEKGEWYGFIGVDLKTPPGGYRVRLEADPSGREAEFEVEVVSKDYGVRRLTLPKKMVDLDAGTLKRVRRESRVMDRLWNGPYLEPLWRGTFERPVPGEVVGPFGRRSVINDQERSPHTGVDLRGEKGTPVRATNKGKVVLVADHFFTGGSVVIDHGGGIQSMYFHLDSVAVKETVVVDKGQIIGRIGSTGRATGPHLHWGLRINGARVDPLSLTALSRQLEE